VARHVDESGLADRRHRSHDFCGKKESQGGGTGNECRSDETHYGFARNCESERDTELRTDHPEPDLPHLLGDRFLVAFLQVARDDRSEDRVEAGL
jgi:hypothetical protein